MQIRFVGFGKGQMKIQQMAFMLLAVTLFFMLAGMFFLIIQSTEFKKSASSQEAENAELFITKISNYPEFSCQKSFDNSGSNCIDMDKVMALTRGNISNYNRYWGNKIENIEVRIIYPEESEVLCTPNNYPNCNTIRLFSPEVSGTSFATYVSACRKEGWEGNPYDKCELAYMMVSYSDYE